MADQHTAEGHPAGSSLQHEKPAKIRTDLPNGRSLRAILVLVTALLIVVPSVDAQDVPDVNTMPLDQLADAIAHTIEVNTVRTPDAPLTFDSATAQGTNVIIHFTVKDSALLAKLKTVSGIEREAMASHVCRNPQSAVSLKRGISLIYLSELADKSDQLEYTIDAAACDSLAVVTPASASELSQLASQVVNELRSDKEKTQQVQQGVTLKELEAKDGIVEERFVVVVPAFEDFYRANIPQTQGMIKGSVCAKFGDSVRRGLRLHLVYEQFETGTKLSEFNIGPSDC